MTAGAAPTGHPHLVIALDTSTDNVGIALRRDGVTIAEFTGTARQRHTQYLLASLDLLCRQQECRPDSWDPQRDLLVVATGPGSFNGIRTGISTALGLSLASQVRVVGISTLEALAYQLWCYHTLDSRTRRAPALSCAVLAAGRGEFYATIYRGYGESWTHESVNLVVTADELAEELNRHALATKETIIVGGSLDKQCVAAIQRIVPAQQACIRVVEPMLAQRRPSFLADLAARHYQDDTTPIQPLYLRRASITRSRQPALATTGDRTQQSGTRLTPQDTDFSQPKLPDSTQEQKNR